MNKLMMTTFLMAATFGVLTGSMIAQETSGPFGLHKGMTQEEVIQLVGKDAVKATVGDTFVFTQVPRQHPAFSGYVLTFSSEEGLLKIVATGKEIQTNSFGENVRASFVELRDTISQSYGHPEFIDAVKPTSVWQGPQYWMMGLWKQERMLAAIWNKDLPNRIHGLALEGVALSPEKAFLKLSYEFDGFNDYLAEQKRIAGKVL